MSNMILFGNGLQKKYNGVAKSKLLTDADKKRKQKDREALHKASVKRRSYREARMDTRDNDKESFDVRAEKEIKLLSNEEENQIKSIKDNAGRIVEKRIEDAKGKTNALAREYELPEPNNPEALAHDRLHCFTCDRKLHAPDVVSQNKLASDLFSEEEIRLLCCWCFGRMGDDEIKVTMKSGKEATKEIRLAIYDPESMVDKNIDIGNDIKKVEQMTKERAIYIKSKIKRYKNIVSMIGTQKHDDLDDERHTELTFLKQFKTRYDACTL